MLKYIRLYEDYTKNKSGSINTEHSWQDLRDTIQQKLPFMIIDFKNKEEAQKCIDEELFDEDFANQIYYLKNDQGEQMKYPSVFIFAKGRSDLKDRAMSFHKRFDVERMIIGEYGKNAPSLYIDGEHVDLGENLFSSLNIDDMSNEDFYKMKSNFYKFIN